MTQPRLTALLTSTDRSRPILTGEVALTSATLDPRSDEPQAIFHAAQVEAEPDIAEISLGTHLLQEAQGTARYAALPVYLSRSFRHNAIFIRSDRSIATPADLTGTRIGIQGLQQTATIWIRGILAEFYGTDLQSIDWVIGGLDRPGSLERSPLGRTPGLRCSPCASDETLSQLLEEGRIDAILSPNPPACFGKPGAAVRRLFPDPASEEQDFFRRTGLFPIMHVLGVKKERLAEFPDLGADLFRAFCTAKSAAQADLVRQNYLRISLPWVADTARKTRALMGPNPWSYGFRNNRATLAALVRYAENDGLIAPGLAPEELFWTPSLDWCDPEDPR